MLPTYEQIQRAAFFRWQRLGCGHGQDRENWLVAEQELLYALNYEVAAHYLLDSTTPRAIGGEGRRICRFCELSEPATPFSEGQLALPAFVGNRSLFTFEECDECHDRFLEGIEAELERFLAPLRSEHQSAPATISLPAFKGLAKLALAVMPRGDLHFFEDAIEWVGNPDHDFDARLFQGLGCYLHLMTYPFPHPWAVLARRVDDDAPMPFMLFFLGTSGVVLQIPVPFCVRDEDLEGRVALVPDVSSPVMPNPEPLRGPRIFIPLSPEPARPARRWRFDSLVNPSLD